MYPSSICLPSIYSLNHSSAIQHPHPSNFHLSTIFHPFMRHYLLYLSTFHFPPSLLSIHLSNHPWPCPILIQTPSLFVVIDFTHRNANKCESEFYIMAQVIHSSIRPRIKYQGIHEFSGLGLTVSSLQCF